MILMRVLAETVAIEAPCSSCKLLLFVDFAHLIQQN